MAKLFNLEYYRNDFSADISSAEIIASSYLKAFEQAQKIVKQRTSTGRILILKEVRDNLVVAK